MAIRDLFQIGPRIAGQILGVPFSQYRATTANNPTASGNLLRSLPAWVTVDQAGRGGSAPLPGKPLRYAMLDQSLVAVGDYLIGADGTTFFISYIGAAEPTQVVLCNKTASLYRPGSAAAGNDFYGGASPATLQPLMAAWPASVLQGAKGEVGEVKLPGDTRLPWAAILLPATAGVQLLPGDWLITTDASPVQYTLSSCELTAQGWRLTASLAAT